MKTLFKLFAILFYVAGIVSCSSESIPSEEYISTTENSMKNRTIQSIGNPMIVSDFIDLVKDDCTELELCFLNSLNPNDTIYVYNQSEVNYPKIDENNIELYKDLAHNKLKLSPLKIEPIIKKSPLTRAWDDLIQNQIVTIGLKSGYNPLLENDVRLLSDISYTYNLTQHKIETSYPCNIVTYANAQGNPSIMLTFVNQGSSAYPIDIMTITYSVLGQVQLSAAFGSLGAGAVIEQVHEFGNVLVPYWSWKNSGLTSTQ